MYKSSSIYDKLPPDIKIPLGFRSHGDLIEGYVSEPIEAVRKFEPMDVLNGALELIDQNNHIITIHGDSMFVEKNEYPPNYEGLFFIVNT